MQATMAPAGIRFIVETVPGEQTGAAVHKVVDSMTGRLRLVTLDLDEAGRYSAALNRLDPNPEGALDNVPTMEFGEAI